MSSLISAPPVPASHFSPPANTPRFPEHHAAPALSPADVGYVDSLMGVAPAQTMATIMLKTGVPMPANLGQDVDMTA